MDLLQQQLQQRQDALAALYTQILPLLGEDPEREGLLKTPVRVARAWLELTRGYAEDPVAILRSALFSETYHNMVVVKDIEFYSLCEHHLLPFFGHVHVAYIPNGQITGLSKFARIVNTFSHRLQVQERMTEQIAECIQEALNPLGDGRCRGTPPLHADARRRQTECRHYYHAPHRNLRRPFRSC